MYLCHACGKYVEREAVDGKLKKWRKSYCEKTGKDVRIWLKLSHNMPHHHSSPNSSDPKLAGRICCVRCGEPGGRFKATGLCYQCMYFPNVNRQRPLPAETDDTNTNQRDSG
jgi:hypothetical protein